MSRVEFALKVALEVNTEMQSLFYCGVNAAGLPRLHLKKRLKEVSSCFALCIHTVVCFPKIALWSYEGARWTFINITAFNRHNHLSTDLQDLQKDGRCRNMRWEKMGFAHLIDVVLISAFPLVVLLPAVIGTFPSEDGWQPALRRMSFPLVSVSSLN